jgi:hypothetical protein
VVAMGSACFCAGLRLAGSEEVCFTTFVLGHLSDGLILICPSIQPFGLTVLKLSLGVGWSASA